MITCTRTHPRTQYVRRELSSPLRAVPAPASRRRPCEPSPPLRAAAASRRCEPSPVQARGRGRHPLWWVKKFGTL